MPLAIGCAIWAYKGWVGELYPKGSKPSDFLRLYGERFTAVEGNTTFYAVPDEATLDRWFGQMPKNFAFLPKIPREITHAGPLAPRLEEAASFAKHMGRLWGRLGPFHLQLPPDYGPDALPDLATFLTEWPRELGDLAVEVRHPGFFYEPEATQLDRLLERLAWARVHLDARPVYHCADDPQAHAGRRKPLLPIRPVLTGPTAMIRFVNHPEPARNEPYLRSWADHVARWLREGVQVYFFSHCPVEERSPAQARAFQRMLEALGAPVPPLPWDALTPAPPRQSALF